MINALNDNLSGKYATIAWHKIIFILIISALSGCSIFAPQPTEISIEETHFNWSQIKSKIQQQNHWSLIGKIGIRTPQDSLTIAINQWLQQNDNFEIELSSTFFGLGASSLKGNNQHLTLTESGEDPIYSEQPNILMESALGFPLPITHLTYWVKGLPAPNLLAKIEFNSQGLPTTIWQDQWQLQLSKYTLVDNIPLPQKIKLEHNNTRIILAIKKWKLL